MPARLSRNVWLAFSLTALAAVVPGLSPISSFAPASHAADKEAAPSPGERGPWEVQVTANSTPRLRFRYTPVLTADYRFWGPEWKWAQPSMEVERDPDGKRRIVGKVDKLGLTLTGEIENEPAHVLSYRYRIDAKEDLKGISGGGIEFRLRPGSPAFEDRASKPQLLPEKRGFQWSVGNGQMLRVEFSRPLGDIYIQGTEKNSVRAMIFRGDVPKGTYDIDMRIQLPEGGRLIPSPAERYGPAKTDDWYKDALLWNAAPLDLSFLNEKPAGKHGRVAARGDQLVFEDGTPVRFWGCNIAAQALFVDKPDIDRHAKRIAELGYNLVRIHHHDSHWVKPRNVFRAALDNTRELDPLALDKLDYWISALKDQGVYVWLDLHVGRRLRPGDVETPAGRIPGFEEIERKDGEFKGFCYFNEQVESLMREFNREYLCHANKYTGLAYKDDPAVMGMLLTNENDITHHFGNLMLPDKKNPAHNAVFEKAVEEFCRETGLPKNTTWRTWEPGTSKIFLNDREYRFGKRLIDELREMGVTVPIATTNLWGDNPLSSLPALTAGDLVDVHSYGESEEFDANAHYVPNYAAYIASAQIYGRPLTVTEWNVPYNTADRFTAPMYMASLASLHGWDALMLYNYSQQTFGRPKGPSTWSTFYDPAITAVMPAAAVAYRQGHVSPAKRTVCVKLDRTQTYFQRVNAFLSPTLRSLAETSRLTVGLPDTKELDWDVETRTGEGVEVVTDLNRDYIPAGANQVQSDTGELTRNWVKGVHTVDSPKTQSVSGWIGGELFALASTRFEVKTAKAVVAVTSLDDRPIQESHRLLLTAVARAVPSDGKMPFLSEPVVATVRITAPAGLRVYPIQPTGTKATPLDVPYADGAYLITLTPKSGSLWFLLEV